MVVEGQQLRVALILLVTVTSTYTTMHLWGLLQAPFDIIGKVWATLAILAATNLAFEYLALPPPAPAAAVPSTPS